MQLVHLVTAMLLSEPFILEQEFQSYTVARDSFLAHLGATLWGSLRHVIAPSVADGAYHYYEKISFQLYFITQEVLIHFLFLPALSNFRVSSHCYCLFQKVRNIKKLPVNLRALTDALSSLSAPSQSVMFSQHL